MQNTIITGPGVVMGLPGRRRMHVTFDMSLLYNVTLSTSAS